MHRQLTQALFTRSLLSTSVALGLGTAGLAAPALGQESLEEVVVTGSRILRRDFEANSPIMTVDEELFENTSTVGVETVMNQLPQFVPAVTQFDTTETQSTATTTPGSSTLSLRGLGSNRNLILLNGRRAMPVNASGAVDMNMIPSSAIQRVETITGGASSVYGADAMAGVVNFILKDDFEGIDLDMQYGVTEEGDGEQERFNGLLGISNASGTGNILLGFEYTRRGEVWRGDRAFYRRGLSDPSVGGTATRLSLNQYAPTGSLGGNPSQAAVNALFSESPPGAVGTTGTFYFNEDGSLFKADDPAAIYKYNGHFVDDTGFQERKVLDDGTIDENQIDTMISIPMERYSLFGSGRLDINDNIGAFVQGLFSQNDNMTRLQYSPAVGPWGASIPHGDEIWPDSLTDPADPDSATAAAYRPGGLHGLDCAPTGGCTESEVFPTHPDLSALLDSRADPNAPWRLGHTLWWAGPRRTENRVTSYQIVAGLEGNLPIRDWTWEAYVSHGTTQTQTELLGYASVYRWREVVTAPNYGRGFFMTGNTDVPYGSGFGGGLGSCTSGLPINSSFMPTDDCQTAITADMQNSSEMEQRVAEFNMQGQLVELPAGMARFALGASYRENSYDFLTDILMSQDSFLDQAAGIFPASNSSGQTTAREVYGELLIPVLANAPFMQEFNIEAGYRYTDNDPSPSVETWKILGDWRVNDRLRLRGGHQVANRAPNIAELFLSRTQTLEVTFDGDYCSTRNPSNPFSANPENNPNAAEVRAICEALMGATGAQEYYSDPLNQPNSSFSFSFVNLVGNPNLENETAETWTLGGVLNLWDDTTVSLDWYSIEIEDMISAQTASSVYRLCMDPATNPDFDPDFEPCRQLVRNPSSGATAPTDVQYSNEAAIRTEGIDVQFDYGVDILNGGLNLNVMLNYLMEMETRVNDAAQWTDWVGTAGPNDLTGVNGGSFDFRTFTTLTYFDNAGWNLSLRWRYLPELESAAAAGSETTILPANEYNIFDVNGGYRFGQNENFLIRFGIENLLDAQPEITARNTDPDDLSSGAGSTDSGFYDVLGRRYYAGLQVRF